MKLLLAATMLLCTALREQVAHAAQTLPANAKRWALTIALPFSIGGGLVARRP